MLLPLLTLIRTPARWTAWRLRVVTLRGMEGLNALPDWKLVLHADEPLPNNVIAMVLDRRVGVRVQRKEGTSRRVGGRVKRASVRSDGRTLDLELVSDFQWAFQKGEDSRVSVKTGPAEVLKAMFAARGLSEYLVLHDSVKTGEERPHFIFYKECPLQTARRLIADEGWYFTVTQTQEGERMTVGDGTVKGQFGKPLVVAEVTPTDDRWPGANEVAWVEEWGESRPGGAVEASSYHWQTPTADLSATGPADESTTRPRPGVYVHDSYEMADDGGRLVRRWCERELAAAGGLSGVSGCVRFAPGRLVTLRGTPHLLTAVRHEVQAGVGERPATYHNTFDAIPVGVTFRPPPLPRPTPPGKVSGVVVGRDGESTATGGDVYADQWGRVRVRLAFDRRRVGEDTAIWVRTDRLWAGNGFGGLFLPPIGSEVTVDFVGGELSRPVIDSYHSNPDTLPPFDPSVETQRYGIYGRPGEGGGDVKRSELDFDDDPAKGRARLAGRQLLELFAGKTGVIDCGEQLVLAVGPKCSLILTPDKIVLKVGDTVIELTEKMLKAVAPDIFLN